MAARRLHTLLLDLWVVALALVLVLPAFTHAGLGLAGDLVFSPRQPLTPDSIGLGDRLPRAVPLDALLALAGSMVPGAVLFRVAVIAGIALAGAAVHRIIATRSTLARVAAATLAVWNPYVVERLALGQWALLLGYGATCWVVLTVVCWRGGPSRWPWAPWAWVGLASCTPTGGVIAVVVAVVLGAGRQTRTWLLLVGCLALQLPWVLPSLLGGAGGVGDPTGVLAFRAGPDAPGGTLVSLLGMGGIWDLDSVPTSRGSLLGLAAAVLSVAAVALAWRRLPVGVGRLLPLALGGLLLAGAARIPGLDEVVRWVVTDVPGGGLVRDSQKWILPWVVLVAVSFGVVVDRVREALARRDTGLAAVAGLVGVVLPLLLLPDAAATTWSTTTPVTYPRDFETVRSELADDADHADHGAMVLLPWRAYRAFEWGGDQTANDPAYAWYDVPLIGSTALPVGDRVVGEDDPELADDVAEALDRSDRAAALADLGIGWVLVYPDDPEAPDVDLDGLDLVVDGDDLQLWRVPGPVADRSGVSAAAFVLVVVLDVLVLVFWIFACVSALWRRSPDSLPTFRADRDEIA